MEVSMWTGLPVKLPSSRIIKLKTVNKLPSIIMLIFPDIKNNTVGGEMEWEAGRAEQQRERRSVHTYTTVTDVHECGCL